MLVTILLRDSRETVSSLVTKCSNRSEDEFDTPSHNVVTSFVRFRGFHTHAHTHTDSLSLSLSLTNIRKSDYKNTYNFITEDI